MMGAVAPRRAETIQAAALAAITNRPPLDPHDIAQAQQLLALCKGWMRATYRHLEKRPDLSRQVSRVGQSLAVLEARLQEEAAR